METKKIMISLPEDSLRALDGISREKTLTRSALIRLAVMDYIKKEKGEEYGK